MSLKVSILGIGNMGKNHLRVLSMLKGVTVVKIFDFNEGALKLLSQQYDVPYTLDAGEALENMDAVIIVTPTSTHFDYFKLSVCTSASFCLHMSFISSGNCEHSQMPCTRRASWDTAALLQQLVSHWITFLR